MKVKLHIPGYPRIGRNRELKKKLESYWAGKATIDELLRTADSIKNENWLKQSALDYITVGDFALYDHVLETSLLFGAVPERFSSLKTRDRYELMFAVARGRSSGSETIGASPMRKWFNTNYHYIVPEISDQTLFHPDAAALLADIGKAAKQGKNIKLVLPGPATYLWLSGIDGSEVSAGSLPEDLCGCYLQLFRLLKNPETTGADLLEWVQLDEPIAAFDRLDDNWKNVLSRTW